MLRVKYLFFLFMLVSSLFLTEGANSVVFGQFSFDALQKESGVKSKEGATAKKKEKTNAPRPDRGPLFGAGKSVKWRSGVILEAREGGACSNVTATIPIPKEYAEQKVRILDENFPNGVRVFYRELKEGGVRELVLKMKELRSGQKIEATVLFEVTRYIQYPPEQTDCYQIPRKTTRVLRPYLRKSTYIESDSKRIREIARDATADQDSDWNKVSALFFYVRKNIKYDTEQVEKPIRGALAALRTGKGDCEDMCALFIALCRSTEIPARLVRLPSHCYAEFYLVDEQGTGYWFPAQVAGNEPFGGMLDTRMILQKGDCYHMPESPKEETLYVKETFLGSVKQNAPDPKYQFIQELVSQ